MLRSDPTVSCLLPAFLRDPQSKQLIWLKEAVESVLKCKDIKELVVIDDGSGAFLEEFLTGLFSSELRTGVLRLIRLRENVGLIRALNFGLMHCSGDMIARLDADDIWLEGSLDRRIEIMRSHEDAAMVFGGMVIENSAMERNIELRYFNRSSLIDHGRNGICMIPHCSVLMRKEAIQAIGGYEFSLHSQYVEDFATWSNFIRFFNVVATGEAEYIYRRHQQSISSTSAELQKENTAFVSERFLRIGNAHLLDQYFSKWKKVLPDSETWRAGLTLASAWARGGQVPTFDEKSVVEEILFDRAVRFDGEWAYVAPTIF